MKAIAYAYPTSYTANRYNRGEGFFFVVIGTLLKNEPHGGDASLANPSKRFSTTEGAEAFADTLPGEYADYYTARPFPGSKFNVKTS